MWPWIPKDEARLMAGVWATEESRHGCAWTRKRRNPAVSTQPRSRAGLDYALNPNRAPPSRAEAEKILRWALGVEATVDVIPAETRLKAKYLCGPDAQALHAALEVLGYKQAEDGSYRR